MQNKINKKILVTGGGSGGHLFSAQSLINSMLDEYLISPKNIIYVGGDLGMENEKDGHSIEQKQMIGKCFKVYFIRAGKLQRRISFNTVRLLLRSILGFIDSYKILKKESPDIVISTGGFVSVPVCIVASLFNMPIYLHEQTVAVGLANKIVGKVARKIFISFKTSSKYFPKEKSIHTGNILRKDIFKKEETTETDSDILQLFKQNKPVIYISGGSLGSHSINMKVLSQLDSLLEQYAVLLQTGDNEKFRDFDLAETKKSKLEEEKSKRFLPVKYVNSEIIGYVFNNMDMFVGRSGANTVYEQGVL
jgi:UDP-N-acetylglucosamine--N-acetylmuramyl-(pentapeptide) pyrophosphoryl-undecaprenol N-acetylglucosamine transferase